MNIDELKTLGRDCFSAFTATFPEKNTRSWEVWAEMCADVPLAAAPYIKEKIIELDSLPRNFGKAVRDLGLEWKYSKTDRSPRFNACPECDPAMPGFLMVWDTSTHRFIARCTCNRDKQWAHLESLTHAEIKRRGWSLTDPMFARPMPAPEAEEIGNATINAWDECAPAETEEIELWQM